MRRTCASRARQRLENALEKIAALLRRRQFQWLRNIRKNSPKAWSDLGQFSRIVAHPPAEIIQARRLRQIAFDDLGERQIGKRFVSFVAVPDGHRKPMRDAYSAISIARRVLPTPGSAPQHDQRAVAAQRTIDRRANRATFGFPPHKSGSFRQRERQKPPAPAAMARGRSDHARRGVALECELALARRSIVAANSHAIGKSGSGW